MTGPGESGRNGTSAPRLVVEDLQAGGGPVTVQPLPRVVLTVLARQTKRKRVTLRLVQVNVPQCPEQTPTSRVSSPSLTTGRPTPPALRPTTTGPGAPQLLGVTVESGETVPTLAKWTEAGEDGATGSTVTKPAEEEPKRGEDIVISQLPSMVVLTVLENVMTVECVLPSHAQRMENGENGLNTRRVPSLVEEVLRLDGEVVTTQHLRMVVTTAGGRTLK